GFLFFFLLFLGLFPSRFALFLGLFSLQFFLFRGPFLLPFPFFPDLFLGRFDPFLFLFLQFLLLFFRDCAAHRLGLAGVGGGLSRRRNANAHRERRDQEKGQSFDPCHPSILSVWFYDRRRTRGDRLRYPPYAHFPPTGTPDAAGMGRAAHACKQYVGRITTLSDSRPRDTVPLSLAHSIPGPARAGGRSCKLGSSDARSPVLHRLR